jgi:hypothetical protein
MNKIVWLAKRNYWIAGIGAIISIFAFLALTFLNVSYSFSLPGLGLGGTTATPPVTFPISATSLASSEGLLWVGLLLVIAVLVVSILFLVRSNPFGSRAAIAVQARLTALGFVIAGGVAALCTVVSLLLIEQSTQSLLGGESSSLNGLGLGSAFSSYFHFTFIWGAGVYLFLAGIVLIVVAAILELLYPTKILNNAESATAWSYPQNQYPQNQYNYPMPTYGPPPSTQGPQPSTNFADPHSDYAGSSQPQASFPPPSSSFPSYPSVSDHQQPPTGPTNPYQPPSSPPPYGQ